MSKAGHLLLWGVTAPQLQAFTQRCLVMSLQNPCALHRASVYNVGGELPELLHGSLDSCTCNVSQPCSLGCGGYARQSLSQQ